ncbi:MAG: serine protease [Planctomycetota bacterium]
MAACLALLCSLSCRSASIERSDAGQIQSPIDDALLHLRLQQELTRLQATGQPPRPATLQQQLGRTRCELSLSKAAPKATTPARIYRRALRSVVALGWLYKCGECDNWHTTAASGFLISESGACVTSYHVVKGCQGPMGAVTAEGRFYRVAGVLAASEADDLAILQLAGRGFKPLRLRPGAPVGSTVFTISHPNLNFFHFSRGMVSRYATLQSTKTRLFITADYAGGSSGGPVLDQEGRAVGVIAGTQPIYYEHKQDDRRDVQMQLKTCIPARAILDLVEPKD